MTPGQTFATLETRRKSRASLILQWLVGPLTGAKQKMLEVILFYLRTLIHFPMEEIVSRVIG